MSKVGAQRLKHTSQCQRPHPRDSKLISLYCSGIGIFNTSLGDSKAQYKPFSFFTCIVAKAS